MSAVSRVGGSSRTFSTMKRTLLALTNTCPHMIRIDPATGTIAGDPWFDHQQVEPNQELMFPTILNRDFTAEQCFRMKVSMLVASVWTVLKETSSRAQETVVKPLLPLITRELKHCIQFGAKRKALEVGTRLTCGKRQRRSEEVHRKFESLILSVRSMFDDTLRWQLVLCRLRQRVLLRVRAGNDRQGASECGVVRER